MRPLTTLAYKRATRALCARDRHLRAVVARHGPPPLWRRSPGFATLVRIILEQQVSLAAARTMYRRLSAHVGRVTPMHVAALGVPGLRRLGLTRQKAAYCDGLAHAILDGGLDLRAIAAAPAGVGRTRLLQVRGIGPWSVDVYYLFALRHPDVWPQGDLALAQALHHVKALSARPSTAEQEVIALQWKPFRSVAARILWHHYLSTRQTRAVSGRKDGSQGRSTVAG